MYIIGLRKAATDLGSQHQRQLRRQLTGAIVEKLYKQCCYEKFVASPTSIVSQRLLKLSLHSNAEYQP
jgi:hypothetical protein